MNILAINTTANSFNYPYMVVLDIAKASVTNSFTHVRESAQAVLNATTLS